MLKVKWVRPRDEGWFGVKPTGSGSLLATWSMSRADACEAPAEEPEVVKGASKKTTWLPSTSRSDLE